LYKAIEKVALPWLASQPAWNMTLRELIAPKWDVPKDNDASTLSSMDHPDGLVQTTEFKLTNDRLLSFTVQSYCCGDNPFFDPNEVDEFEYEYEDDKSGFVFKFDSESYKNELMADKLFVAEYGEDGVLSPAILDECAEIAMSEAEEEAREKYDDKILRAPFTEPFIIESLTIKQTNVQGKKEMEIMGDQFVDLWSLRTLADHWTLLDEMSLEFSTLSSFIKNHYASFEKSGSDIYNSLFYITDFVLTTETCFDDMAIAVANYYKKAGGLSNVFVLFHSDALGYRYSGAPFQSIRELSVEYNRAKVELVQSFEAQGIACAYISP
jgi:hypothetical protein